ncbi:unnamed protein product [Mesocestoides corti]|uniref:PDZ domain-containing protein n=1 Tax=Mesocestoides corti TaxID=53468 RepID=A0A0R3U225_MESCO|nr:unnamed protein product [Mesocestoides corti]
MNAICSYSSKFLRTSWISTLKWQRVAASPRFISDKAYHRYSHREKARSSFVPYFALIVSPLSSAFVHRSDDDNDLTWSILSTVKCETVPSSARLSAIKSLDIVADVVEEVSPSVVSITTAGHFFQLNVSMGSGFIVDHSGLVITNAHVVGHKQALKVSLKDGRDFDARVLAVDMNSDLALVQINADTSTLSQLPVLEFAPAEQKIRPGEFVIALGSPLMLSNTVTMGVVSAVERDLGNRTGLKYIQTDAIITFGNSGGPLVSLYGKVIGVNTMIADTGLGFAVPIDQVQRFMEAAKRALAEEQNKQQTPRRRPLSESSSGSPRHQRTGSWSWFGGDNDAGNGGSLVVGSGERQSRYLGLVMRTLTPDLTFELAARGLLRGGPGNSVHNGVYIHGVIRGSPAERVGLKPGDIITAIDGNKVINANEVTEIVENRDTFSITVLRNGNTVEISEVKTEPV